MAISIYAVLDLDNCSHRVPLNDNTLRDAIENATTEGSFFLTYTEAENYVQECLEDEGKNADYFTSNNLRLYIVKFDLDVSAIHQIVANVRYEIAYSTKQVAM